MTEATAVGTPEETAAAAVGIAGAEVVTRMVVLLEVVSAEAWAVGKMAAVGTAETMGAEAAKTEPPPEVA